ncbi:MAG TPA: glycosyl hydrolase [Phycisphaerales bacterium]|nr:glycosyl hydrolase [Phycisphaerales bacterium]|tara:strand:+ start:30075 stop:31475 length:1401 start_codon:yes stop_codon:yes gene_type:complete
MKIDAKLKPNDLKPAIERVLTLAARKSKAIDRGWEPAKGTPVFTVKGKYTSMGWTEWTQGFMFGNMILAGDGLDDAKLMKAGTDRTLKYMLPHVTHIGVHDHGFNNLSTYGNIIRLIREKKIKDSTGIEETCKTAVAASGAVQASRWEGVRQEFKDKHSARTRMLGYIYSFNGPHSLFIDTMRTTRILGVAWQLGHILMHENDRGANLLKRSVLHGLTTSQYIIYHGDTEKTYDVRGRTAHEGTFNRNDGCFRARSTQQGYSPFSTWTRGLAWAMLGYAEELEFFKTITPAKFKEATGLNKADVLKVYENCAKETCDHYIKECSTLDGITYWDDGAPNLHKLGDWQNQNADPYNDHEPVDSSASAIAAQGLIRLGNYLGAKGKSYTQAGLTVARTLFDEPYLSTKANHQGLLLHSIYHWPNHWDHVPAGSKVANGEASMWGDYHQLELAILIQRMGNKAKYPTFYL